MTSLEDLDLSARDESARRGTRRFHQRLPAVIAADAARGVR